MDKKIRLEECTDAELVARCLTGEREAFDALAVRYLGAMHAAALARLREREAAEEAVQEALLRAYLNISDLKNPSKAGPWMTTIARNMAINWLKSGKRRSDVLRLVPLSEVEHALADTAEKGAREKMEAQETRSCLEAALNSLEDEERELVLLHYAEGLNNNEISQQIGVHPTTVGRRLDRAFARMRSDLEPVLREEGRKLRPSKKFQARTLLVISAAAALSAETKSAIAATGGTVAVTQASAAMAAIGTGAAFATDAAVKGSILMTLKAKIVALVAAVGLLGGVGYVAQESAEPPVKKMQANVVFSEMGRYQFRDGGYIMNVAKTDGSKMDIRWKDPDSENGITFDNLENYRWIMCWDKEGRLWSYHPQLLFNIFVVNSKDTEGVWFLVGPQSSFWKNMPAAFKAKLPKQIESIYHQIKQAYGGNTMHIPIDKEILDKITVDIEPLASPESKVSSSTLNSAGLESNSKETTATDKKVPTKADVEAFGWRLFETAASGDRQAFENLFFTADDAEGFMDLTPEEAETINMQFRSNLNTIDQILRMAKGAKYVRCYLGEQGEIRHIAPGDPDIPKEIKSAFVVVVDMHVVFKVQDERWEIVGFLQRWISNEDFDIARIELLAKPEENAESGKTYVTAYQNSGDGSALYGAFYTEVESGDRLEDIWELLGSRVKFERNNEKRMKLLESAAERYPELYPDGVEKDDVFLSCPIGDGSSRLELQFRNERLINHKKEDYKKYEKFYSVGGPAASESDQDKN